MATKNIVPRATGEGSIGKITKHWGSAYIDSLINLKGLHLDDAVELTISSGVITVSQSFHTVDTEGDITSDDLDTINGTTAVNLLFLATTAAASPARTVVLKHGTGNIVTPDGSDISLDDADKMYILKYHSGTSSWHVIGSSGGGSAISPTYSSKNTTFSSISTATTSSVDLTGMPSSRLHLTNGKLYISSVSTGGTSINISCSISFFGSDGQTLKSLQKKFYFNLTYTEINNVSGYSSGATAIIVDDSSGIIAEDKVRFLAGAPSEVVGITSVSGNTLNCTATINGQADGTGTVVIAELPDFDLEDIDDTDELHIEFETFDAPGDTISVYFESDVVSLG